MYVDSACPFGLHMSQLFSIFNNVADALEFMIRKNRVREVSY